MRRVGIVAAASVMAFVLMATPALACGGLLSPNGTVNLARTSTLAAYHDGVEHYITGFEFAGAGGKFGSIIPLPDVPSDVIKGGDWTLQRLAIETQPQPRRVALFSATTEAAGAKADVIMTREIDALDLTVLRGGGDEVGLWAKENGFQLPPDAPEVLDFYAKRSPIFMAASFDADRAAAQGAGLGDSTPVHVVIPTDDPWVPLRILGLGKSANEDIDADVYLLTDDEPSMLPDPGFASPAMTLEQSGEASSSLLTDLRSDRGMKWLPRSDMWLTYLRVDGKAGDLKHDLALDAGGGAPSLVDAGLTNANTAPAFIPSEETQTLWAWAVAAMIGGLALLTANRVATSRR